MPPWIEEGTATPREAIDRLENRLDLSCIWILRGEQKDHNSLYIPQNTILHFDQRVATEFMHVPIQSKETTISYCLQHAKGISLDATERIDIVRSLTGELNVVASETVTYLFEKFHELHNFRTVLSSYSRSHYPAPNRLI